MAHSHAPTLGWCTLLHVNFIPAEKVYSEGSGAPHLCWGPVAGGHIPSEGTRCLQGEATPPPGRASAGP